MKHPNKQPFSPKSKPLTRKQRLQRNFIVSLIFTPIVAIGVILGERLFRGAFAVDDFGLRVFALVAAFAWILVIIFMWRWIAQVVDRWILERETLSPKKPPQAVEYNWQHDPFKDILRYGNKNTYLISFIFSVLICFLVSFFILFAVDSDVLFDYFIHLFFGSVVIMLIFFTINSPLSDDPVFDNANAVLNPRTRTLLSNYQEQIVQGNYPLLRQRLEQAKAIYIDWATMFIEAELDIYTGELERGLDLTDQLLDPLLYPRFKYNGNFEALRQRMVVKTLTLKLDGLILQHNYHQANDVVEQLLKFEDRLYSTYLYNTLATLYLFQGDSEQAAKYLLKLRRITERLPRWLFAYNRVLWAWCSAYQRDFAMVDKLVLSALENSDPKLKSYHSCIYLFAGFARRELGQPDLMRLMFEEAFRIDPEGVYGKMARRELETLQSLTKSKRDVPLKAKS